MVHQLEEIVSDLVERKGIFGIIGSMLATIATLVTIGLFPNAAESAQTALYYVFGVVTFVLIIIIVSLVRSHRRLCNRLVDREQSLIWFTKAAWARPRESDFYSIEKWHEVLTVGKNGDTTIVVSESIVVGGEAIDLIWMHRSRTEGVPLPDRIKEKVRVQALTIDDGCGDGARIRSTTTWQDSHLRIFLNFDPPLTPNRRRQFKVVIFWPEYMKTLLDGQTETMDWKFNRPVADFSSSLVLRKECRIADRVRVSYFGDVDQLEQRDSPNGDISVDLRNHPQVKEWFGYRIDRGGIDLKGGVL
ncbi:MAG: hypothetical protein FWF02_07965 [Micrococcales bacterium]|nr:hypothetical protein [Micrococcales bacterium]MCL2667626.1 hypothetical protein [Micrococcales bacterium]